MFDEIRKNLDKVTGELIESFVSFDKNQVLQFQAGLHVLHSAQKDLDDSKKINLHAICDTKALEELLAEHGISKDTFDKVPSIISDFEAGKVEAYKTLKQLPYLLQDAVEKVNTRVRNIYEVPASGMIAVTLNLVDSNVKNALIAGQAGERTLQAAERASKVKRAFRVTNKDNILRGRLYDFGNTQRFARPYIDGFGADPKYLIAARATNHLADLLEGAVMLEPDIVKYEDVKKTLDVLKGCSIEIFSQVSQRLNEFGEQDAGKKIGKLAKHLAKEYKVDSLDNKKIINTMKRGLESANIALKNEKIFSKKESEDFGQLVTDRLKQLEEA